MDKREGKPTLKELQKQRVASLAAHKWEELATELDFDDDGTEIGRIKREEGRDLEKSCREVLMMWLQGKGRAGPRTWGKLLEHLTEAGAEEAVKAVEKFLQGSGTFAASAEAASSERPHSPHPPSDFSLTSSISPREYQLELARCGLKGENYIFIAPTGTGKTLVVAIVISQHLKKLGNKGRVIFVTHTRSLSEQQAEEVKRFIPGAHIQSTTGGDDIMIGSIIDDCDVIACTAGKLLDELRSHSGRVSISKVSLLVIDECHHVRKSSPEAQVMELYLEAKYSGEKVPQVIGLTASPGAGDNRGLELEKTLDHLISLCALMDASSGIKMVEENFDELQRHTNKPDTTLKIIQERDESEPFIQCVKDEMIKLEQAVSLKCPFRRWSQQYETIIQQKKKLLQETPDPAKRDEICTLELLRCYCLALNVYMDLRKEDALGVLAEHSMPSEEQRTPHETMLWEGLCSVVRDLEKLEPVQNPLLKHSEEILLKQFTENPDSQAIFFVRTKKHAQSACDWLSKLPSLNLKPSIMTGHNRETGYGMTDGEQEQVLQEFRKGECNILVATSVAEEGLDIPACNLVIRFQHVTNEIGKEQSKGRARARDASAFTLVSSGSSKHLQEMKNEELNLLVTKALCWLPDSDVLQQDMGKIQQEILMKRNLKMKFTAAKKNTVQCENIRLLCIKCKTFACNGSDVYTTEESNHHLVPSDDFKTRYTSRPHPERKTISGRIPFEKTHKIHCAGCDQDWGIICIWKIAKGYELPVIKCVSFLFEIDGRPKTFKKWSAVPFTVRPLSSRPEYQVFAVSD